MNVKVIALFAFIICAITPQVRAQVSRADQTAVRKCAQANNRFAFDLYRHIAKKQTDFFFSPFSAFMALTLMYEGADGDTASEMAHVLRVDREMVSSGLNMFQKSLTGAQQDGIQLEIVNSFFPQIGYPFQPAFLAALKAAQTETIPVDYRSDPEGARQLINTKVADDTHQRVLDILPPASVPRGTLLALANAVYFKGDWLRKFEKAATQSMLFHVDSDREVQAQIMHQRNTFRYAGTDVVQLLSLPYIGDRLSMLILLPTALDKLEEVERTVTQEEFYLWKSKMRNADVSVFLPKVNTTTDLGDIGPQLREMGMKRAFSPGADFFPIVGKSIPFLGASPF